MQVISASAQEFVTFAKITDGTDTVILEFSNTPICGIHEFKRSALTEEEYEDLNPDTERILDLQVILENNATNFTALFTAYNA